MLASGLAANSVVVAAAATAGQLAGKGRRPIRVIKPLYVRQSVAGSESLLRVNLSNKQRRRRPQTISASMRPTGSLVVVTSSAAVCLPLDTGCCVQLILG